MPPSPTFSSSTPPSSRLCLLLLLAVLSFLAPAQAQTQVLPLALNVSVPLSLTDQSEVDLLLDVPVPSSQVQAVWSVQCGSCWSQSPLSMVITPHAVSPALLQTAEWPLFANASTWWLQSGLLGVWLELNVTTPVSALAVQQLGLQVTFTVTSTTLPSDPLPYVVQLAPPQALSPAGRPRLFPSSLSPASNSTPYSLTLQQAVPLYPLTTSLQSVLLFSTGLLVPLHDYTKQLSPFTSSFEINLVPGQTLDVTLLPDGYGCQLLLQGSSAMTFYNGLGGRITLTWLQQPALDAQAAAQGLVYQSPVFNFGGSFFAPGAGLGIFWIWYTNLAPQTLQLQMDENASGPFWPWLFFNQTSQTWVDPVNIPSLQYLQEQVNGIGRSLFYIDTTLSTTWAVTGTLLPTNSSSSSTGGVGDGGGGGGAGLPSSTGSSGPAPQQALPVQPLNVSTCASTQGCSLQLGSAVSLYLVDASWTPLRFTVPNPSSQVQAVWSVQCGSCWSQSPLSMVITPHAVSPALLQTAEWPLFANASTWWLQSGLLGVWLELNVTTPVSALAVQQLGLQVTFTVTSTTLPSDPLPYVVQLAPPQALSPAGRPRLFPSSLSPASNSTPYSLTLQQAVPLYPLTTSLQSVLLFSTGLLVPLHDYTKQLSPFTSSFEINLVPGQTLDVTLLPDGYGCQLLLQGSSAMTFYNGLGGRITLTWLQQPALDAQAAAQGLVYQSPVFNFGGSFFAPGAGLGIFWIWYTNLAPQTLQLQMDENASGPFWPWLFFNQTSQTWVDPVNIPSLQYLQEQVNGIGRSLFYIDTTLSTTWAVTGTLLPTNSSSSSTGGVGDGGGGGGAGLPSSTGSSGPAPQQALPVQPLNVSTCASTQGCSLQLGSAVSLYLVDASWTPLRFTVPNPSSQVQAVWSVQCGSCWSQSPLSMVITPHAVSPALLQTAEWPLFANASTWWLQSGLLGVWLELNVTTPVSALAVQQLGLQVTFTVTSTTLPSDPLPYVVQLAPPQALSPAGRPRLFPSSLSPASNSTPYSLTLQQAVPLYPLTTSLQSVLLFSTGLLVPLHDYTKQLSPFTSSFEINLVPGQTLDVTLLPDGYGCQLLLQGSSAMTFYNGLGGRITLTWLQQPALDAQAAAQGLVYQSPVFNFGGSFFAPGAGLGIFWIWYTNLAPQTLQLQMDENASGPFWPWLFFNQTSQTWVDPVNIPSLQYLQEQVNGIGRSLFYIDTTLSTTWAVTGTLLPTNSSSSSTGGVGDGGGGGGAGLPSSTGSSGPAPQQALPVQPLNVSTCASTQGCSLQLGSAVSLYLVDASWTPLRFTVPNPSSQVQAVWSVQCGSCWSQSPLSMVITPHAVSPALLQTAEWPLFANASTWWLQSGLLGVWLELNVTTPVSALAVQQLGLQVTFTVTSTTLPSDPLPYVVQLAPPQALSPAGRPRLFPSSLSPASNSTPYSLTLQQAVPLYPLTTSLQSVLLFSTGLLVPLHDYTKQLSPFTSSFEINLVPGQTLDVTLLPDGYGCQLLLQGSSAMTFYNGLGGRITLTWLQQPALDAQAAAQGLVYQSPVFNFGGSFFAPGAGLGIFWIWYTNLAPQTLQLQMDENASGPFWPWLFFNQTSHSWVDPVNVTSLQYLQEQVNGIGRSLFYIDTTLSTTWAVTGRLPAGSTYYSTPSSSTGLAAPAASGSTGAGQPLPTQSTQTLGLSSAQPVTLSAPLSMPGASGNATAVWVVSCAACSLQMPIYLQVVVVGYGSDLYSSAEWPLFTTPQQPFSVQGVVGVGLRFNVSSSGWSQNASLLLSMLQLSFSVQLTTAQAIDVSQWQWQQLAPTSYTLQLQSYLGRPSTWPVSTAYQQGVQTLTPPPSVAHTYPLSTLGSYSQGCWSLISTVPASPINSDGMYALQADATQLLDVTLPALSINVGIYTPQAGLTFSFYNSQGGRLTTRYVQQDPFVAATLQCQGLIPLGPVLQMEGALWALSSYGFATMQLQFYVQNVPVQLLNSSQVLPYNAQRSFWPWFYLQLNASSVQWVDGSLQTQLPLGDDACGNKACLYPLTSLSPYWGVLAHNASFQPQAAATLQACQTAVQMANSGSYGALGGTGSGSGSGSGSNSNPTSSTPSSTGSSGPAPQQALPVQPLNVSTCASTQGCSLQLGSAVSLYLVDASWTPLRFTVPNPSSQVQAVWSVQCGSCWSQSPLSMVITPHAVSPALLQTAEWPLFANASTWWLQSGLLGVWLELNVTTPVSALAVQQLGLQVTFTVTSTTLPSDPLPYVVQLAPPQALSPAGRPRLFPSSLSPASNSTPYSLTLQQAVPLYPLTTSLQSVLLFSTGLLVPLHDYTKQLSPFTSSFEINLVPGQTLDVTLLPDGYGCQLLLQGSSAMTFYNGLGGRITLTWLQQPALDAQAAAQGLVYQSPVFNFGGSFFAPGAGLGIFWIWYTNLAPQTLQLQMDENASGPFWPWLFFNQTSHSWVDPVNVTSLQYLQEQVNGIGRSLFYIDTTLSTTWAVTGRLPAGSTYYSTPSSSTGLAAPAASGSTGAGQPLPTQSTQTLGLSSAQPVTLSAPLSMPGASGNATAVWVVSCAACSLQMPIYLQVVVVGYGSDLYSSAEWPLFTTPQQPFSVQGVVGVGLRFNVSSSGWSQNASLLLSMLQLSFSVQLTTAQAIDVSQWQWQQLAPTSYTLQLQSYLGRPSTWPVSTAYQQGVQTLTPPPSVAHTYPLSTLGSYSQGCWSLISTVPASPINSDGMYALQADATQLLDVTLPALSINVGIYTPQAGLTFSFYNSQGGRLTTRYVQQDPFVAATLQCQGLIPLGPVLQMEGALWALSSYGFATMQLQFYVQNVPVQLLNSSQVLPYNAQRSFWPWFYLQLNASSVQWVDGSLQTQLPLGDDACGNKACLYPLTSLSPYWGVLAHNASFQPQAAATLQACQTAVQMANSGSYGALGGTGSGSGSGSGSNSNPTSSTPSSTGSSGPAPQQALPVQPLNVSTCASTQGCSLQLGSAVSLYLVDASWTPLRFTVPNPSSQVQAVWSVQCGSCWSQSPLSMVITPHAVSPALLQTAEWPLFANASTWWLQSGLLGVWLELNVTTPVSALAVQQLGLQVTFTVTSTTLPSDPLPYVVQLAPPQALSPAGRPRLFPSSLSPASNSTPYSLTLQQAVPLYPLTTSLQSVLLFSTGLLVPLHDYTKQLSPFTSSFEINLVPGQTLDVTLLPDGYGCQLLLQGSSAMTFYNGLGGRITLTWLQQPALDAQAAAQGLVYQSPVFNFGGSFFAPGAGLGIFWIWYTNLAPQTLQLQMDENASGPFWPWLFFNQTSHSWVDPVNVTSLQYLQEQVNGIGRSLFYIDTTLSTTWAVTGRLPAGSTYYSTPSSSTGLAAPAASGSTGAGQPLPTQSTQTLGLSSAQPVTLSAPLSMPGASGNATAVWVVSCAACSLQMPIYLQVVVVGYGSDLYSSAEWPLFTTPQQPFSVQGVVGVGLRFNVSSSGWSQNASLLLSMLQLSFSVQLTTAQAIDVSQWQWQQLAPTSYTLQLQSYLGRPSTWPVSTAYQQGVQTLTPPPSVAHTYPLSTLGSYSQGCWSLISTVPASPINSDGMYALQADATQLLDVTLPALSINVGIYTPQAGLTFSFYNSQGGRLTTRYVQQDPFVAATLQCQGLIPLGPVLQMEGALWALSSYGFATMQLQFYVQNVPVQLLNSSQVLPYNAQRSFWPWFYLQLNASSVQWVDGSLQTQLPLGDDACGNKACLYPLTSLSPYWGVLAHNASFQPQAAATLQACQTAVQMANSGSYGALGSVGSGSGSGSNGAGGAQSSTASGVWYNGSQASTGSATSPVQSSTVLLSLNSSVSTTLVLQSTQATWLQVSLPALSSKPGSNASGNATALWQLQCPQCSPQMPIYLQVVVVGYGSDLYSSAEWPLFTTPQQPFSVQGVVGVGLRFNVSSSGWSQNASLLLSMLQLSFSVQLTTAQAIDVSQWQWQQLAPTSYTLQLQSYLGRPSTWPVSTAYQQGVQTLTPPPSVAHTYPLSTLGSYSQGCWSLISTVPASPINSDGMYALQADATQLLDVTLPALSINVGIYTPQAGLTFSFYNSQGGRLTTRYVQQDPFVAATLQCQGLIPLGPVLQMEGALWALSSYGFATMQLQFYVQNVPVQLLNSSQVLPYNAQRSFWPWFYLQLNASSVQWVDGSLQTQLPLGDDACGNKACLYPLTSLSPYWGVLAHNASFQPQAAATLQACQTAVQMANSGSYGALGSVGSGSGSGSNGAGGAQSSTASGVWYNGSQASTGSATSPVQSSTVLLSLNSSVSTTLVLQSTQATWLQVSLPALSSKPGSNASGNATALWQLQCPQCSPQMPIYLQVVVVGYGSDLYSSAEWPLFTTPQQPFSVQGVVGVGLRFNVSSSGWSQNASLLLSMLQLSFSVQLTTAQAIDVSQWQWQQLAPTSYTLQLQSYLGRPSTWPVSTAYQQGVQTLTPPPSVAHTYPLSTLGSYSQGCWSLISTVPASPINSDGMYALQADATQLLDVTLPALSINVGIYTPQAGLTFSFYNSQGGRLTTRYVQQDPFVAATLQCQGLIPLGPVLQMEGALWALSSYGFATMQLQFYVQNVPVQLLNSSQVLPYNAQRSFWPWFYLQLNASSVQWVDGSLQTQLPLGDDACGNKACLYPLTSLSPYWGVLAHNASFQPQAAATLQACQTAVQMANSGSYGALGSVGSGSGSGSNGAGGAQSSTASGVWYNGSQASTGSATSPVQSSTVLLSLNSSVSTTLVLQSTQATWLQVSLPALSSKPGSNASGNATALWQLQCPQCSPQMPIYLQVVVVGYGSDLYSSAEWPLFTTPQQPFSVQGVVGVGLRFNVSSSGWSQNASLLLSMLQLSFSVQLTTAQAIDVSQWQWQQLAPTSYTLQLQSYLGRPSTWPVSTAYQQGVQTLTPPPSVAHTYPLSTLGSYSQGCWSLISTVPASPINSDGMYALQADATQLLDVTLPALSINVGIYTPQAGLTFSFYNSQGGRLTTRYVQQDPFVAATLQCQGLIPLGPVLQMEGALWALSSYGFATMQLQFYVQNVPVQLLNSSQVLPYNAQRSFWPWFYLQLNASSVQWVDGSLQTQLPLGDDACGNKACLYPLTSLSPYWGVLAHNASFQPQAAATLQACQTAVQMANSGSYGALGSVGSGSGSGSNGAGGAQSSTASGVWYNGSQASTGSATSPVQSSTVLLSLNSSVSTTLVLQSTQATWLQVSLPALSSKPGSNASGNATALWQLQCPQCSPQMPIYLQVVVVGYGSDLYSSAEWPLFTTPQQPFSVQGVVGVGLRFNVSSSGWSQNASLLLSMLQLSFSVQLTTAQAIDVSQWQWQQLAPTSYTLQLQSYLGRPSTWPVSTAYQQGVQTLTPPPSVAHTYPLSTLGSYSQGCWSLISTVPASPINSDGMYALQADATQLLDVTLPALSINVGIYTPQAGLTFSFYNSQGGRLTTRYVQQDPFVAATLQCQGLIPLGPVLQMEGALWALSSYGFATMQLQFYVQNVPVQLLNSSQVLPYNAQRSFWPWFYLQLNASSVQWVDGSLQTQLPLGDDACGNKACLYPLTSLSPYWGVLAHNASFQPQAAATLQACQTAVQMANSGSYGALGSVGSGSGSGSNGAGGAQSSTASGVWYNGSSNASAASPSSTGAGAGTSPTRNSTLPNSSTGSSQSGAGSASNPSSSLSSGGGAPVLRSTAPALFVSSSPSSTGVYIPSCPGGSILTTNGSCLFCPAGTYSVGGNSSACTACSSGSYSSAQGSSRCLTCQLGFVAMQTFCSPCPVDTYYDSLQCFNCSPGTGTNNRLAQTSCVLTLPVPSNLTAGTATNSSVSMSWTFSSAYSAASSVQFIVQQRNAAYSTVGFANSAGVQLSNSTTGSTLTYTATISGLSPLTTYSFQVLTVLGNLTSVPCSPVTTSTAAVPPAAPSALKLLFSNSSAMTVSWTAAAAYSSVPAAVISNYTLKLSSGGAVVLTVTLPSSSLNYQFTTLSASTSYTVQVQSVMANGLLSAFVPTPALTVVTPLAPPPTLASTNCTKITSTTCLLTMYGTLATSQTVTLFNSAGKLVKPVTLNGASAQLGYYQFTGLTPNTRYLANVAQMNTQGSSPSVSYNFTTLYAAPKLLSLTAGGGLGWLPNSASMTAAFDSDTTMGNVSLTALGSISSLMSFSPLLVDVAAVRAVWADNRTVVMTFTTATSGAAPVAGKQIATVLGSANVQVAAGAGSDVCTSASPPLQGSFGVLSPIFVQPTQSGNGSASVQEGFTLSFATVRQSQWLAFNDTQLQLLAAAGSTTLLLTLNSTTGTLTSSTLVVKSTSIWTTLSQVNVSIPDQMQGSMSIFLSLYLYQGSVSSSLAQSPLDNSAISLTVTTYNHPPTITISAAVPHLYSEQTGSLAGLIQLNDPDVALFASAPLKLQVTVDSAGVLNYTSVPASVTVAGASLIGSLADLQTALQSLTLTLPVLTSGNATLYVTLNDQANGGAGALTASATVSLGSDCSTAAAPVLQSVTFSADGSSLLVQLDRSFTTNAPILSVFSAESIASFGSAASAAQTGSSTLTVQLGARPSIALATSISLASGVLSRCPASTVFADPTISAAVLAPANPVVPVITLSGPSVVSSCDAVTLTSISSGLAGRAGAFTWSATNQLLSATATYGSSLSLASGSLLPDTSYTVSVQVTNFLGVTSSPAVFSFNVSSLPLPLLAIQGPQVAVLYQYQLPSLYTLRSQTVLSACWQSGSQQLLFQWSDVIGNASNVLAAAASTTGTSLSLPTALLQMGNTYTFQLTATAQSDSQLTVSAVVSLYMAIPPLELSPQTSTSVSVSALSPLVMQATLQDPSLNSLAAFSWQCLTTSGEVCVDQITFNQLDLTAFTGTQASLTAGQLASDQYLFTVQAQYTGVDGSISQSAVLTYGVYVSADPIPSVQLTTLAPASAVTSGSILSSSMVSLSASAQLPDGTILLDSNPDVTFLWVLTGANTELLDTDSVGDEVSSSLNLNQDRDDGFFSPGSSYTYTVLVYYFDELSGALLESSAAVTLTTNFPPSQGELTVDPLEGVSLNTTFTLQAVNWVGQTDLSYAFYTYQMDATGAMTQTFLSAYSPAASITLSYLPASNLTLGVAVRDLLNATSVFEVAGVVISAPHFGDDTGSSRRRLLSADGLVASLSSTLATGVATAANILDGSSVVQLLLVVQSELQNVTVDAAVLQLTQTMLADLNQFAAYASATQVAQTMATISTSGALTTSSASTVVSLTQGLLSSGTLQYSDYGGVVDSNFAALSILDASASQASYSAITSALLSTLGQVESGFLSGDASYWARASQGCQAYVLRFNALSRSGSNFSLTSQAQLTPTLSASSALALAAGPSPVLLDARLLSFSSASLAGVDTSLGYTQSSAQAVRVDIAWTNGSAMLSNDMAQGGLAFNLTISLIVNASVNASLCTGQSNPDGSLWLCSLVCVVYDETAHTLSNGTGCVLSTAVNANGSTVATLTTQTPGVYVVATQRTLQAAPPAPVPSSSTASTPQLSSSSALPAQSSSSSDLPSSSSSTPTPSSSPSSSDGQASLGSAASSSSSASVNASFSTSLPISSSSSSVLPLSSTSSYPPTPAPSLEVSFYLTGVTISNLTAFVPLLTLDLATFFAQAAGNGAVPEWFVSYIRVKSVNGTAIAAPASRRLLGQGDVPITFVLLGSVAQVQGGGGVSAQSLVSSFQQAASQGTLTASNTGATIPAQTVTVVTVATTASSSSTGSPQTEAGPDSGDGTDEVALGVGLGLGLGIGVPLLLGGMLLLVLWTEKLGPFKPAGADRGVSPVQPGQSIPAQAEAAKKASMTAASPGRVSVAPVTTSRAVATGPSLAPVEPAATVASSAAVAGEAVPEAAEMTGEPHEEVKEQTTDGEGQRAPSPDVQREDELSEDGVRVHF